MKEILLYFPDTIYPLSMGNRVRTIEKIKALSENNSVTFLSIVETEEQKNETIRILSDYCKCEFIFRPGKRSLYGIFLRSKWKIFDYLGFLPHDYLVTNGAWLRHEMKKIFKNQKTFHSIVCDYWYGASAIFGFFENSPAHVVIDTHNVLSDQRELEINKFQKTFAPKRWIRKYKQLEKNSLSKADVLIAISKNDFKYYKSHYPNIKIALISAGIDLCRLSNFNQETKGSTVLFYGNLGDEQNIIAFNRLWLKIFPVIRKEIPGVQLLVVGSNATDEMLKLNSLDYVNVTGFVENPFESIRKAKIHIIAMETASGFRVRIPEVMGMGIPTIGTHNALDCIELEGELQTFVTDNDKEMADTAIRLLKDDEYWSRISAMSKEFIAEHYSLQKTYKKLENYL